MLGLLCLLSELCCMGPYLLYVFPVVLFIILGGCFKAIILLYCVSLASDMIKITGHETNQAITSLLLEPSLRIY